MIIAMYIAPQKNAAQQPCQIATVVKGKGLEGDRAFGKIKEPGQNITFIEKEEIERFNSEYKQNITQDATRRNIITKGVRLNDLVGKEFFIGEVKFKGVELCEPCSKLGRLLANDTIEPKGVVGGFLHRAGLRADVLSDGEIEVGMKFDF